MSRSVRLVLLSLTLFLALFPLAAGRPGQPPTLKADEPAYMLMAMSLVEDGDLRAEEKDIQRAFDEFPYLPVNNLILMTPDNWQTVYFGKPYVYSMFAAPLVGLFGVPGFHSFNLLLLMAMVVMGTIYLREHNSETVAALFACAFFVLGPAFAYAFWIHPEIINMFSVAACLFLAFHLPSPPAGFGIGSHLRGVLADPRWRTAGSAAVLAIAVYNKPMLFLLGVPALWLVFKRQGTRGALTWIAAALVGVGVLIGISMAFTGKATAYLGVDRGGLKVLSPTGYVDAIDDVRGRTELHTDEAANSWHWLARPPVLEEQFLEDLGYFLIGRHTGLVPYMPLGALAVLLFLLHGRRFRERWLLLASLAVVALTFQIWIPFNWHGGGGFIGNRYFANAYPAFLFLVTAVRPVWLALSGTAFASVLLGAIMVTPWGAPVPQPTMQAHVRGGLFRFFPLELSFRTRIPGYDTFGYRGVSITGRRDVFEVADEQNGVFWIRGATRSELWFSSLKPLPKLIFEIVSRAPDNEIDVEVGDVRETLVFEGVAGPPDNKRRVVLEPSGPTKTRVWQGQPEYMYRLIVAPRTGRHERGNMLNVKVNPLFYIGAEVAYLGTGSKQEIVRENRIEWVECDLPKSLPAAAQGIEIPVRVRNTGVSTWGMRGARQVNLVYRWLREPEGRLDSPRGRETLHSDVRPGEDLSKYMRVNTPEEPGRYTLVFDAIRRHGSLFSTHGGDTCQREVDVLPSSASNPAEGAQ